MLTHALRLTKRIPQVWWLSLVLTGAILAGGGIWFYQKTTPPQTEVAITAYSVQPDDLLALAQYSDLVLEGVVKEVRPAVWTTPDGQAPTNIQMAVNDPNTQLRTPVLMAVEHVFKGQVFGEVLFSMIGAGTEDYRVVTEDDRKLAGGMRIIVFLSLAPKDAGPWAKISPYYPNYYFIVAGETLVGTQKNIARATLEEQLAVLEVK